MEILALGLVLGAGVATGYLLSYIRTQGKHKLQRVENKEARFGAASHYYRMRYFDPSGDIETFLVTANEMTVLTARAKSNPEDLN
jgi:hypothetical protein